MQHTRTREKHSKASRQLLTIDNLLQFGMPDNSLIVIIKKPDHLPARVHSR